MNEARRLSSRRSDAHNTDMRPPQERQHEKGDKAKEEESERQTRGNMQARCALQSRKSDLARQEGVL
jgi:hypothetical protein